jgi:4-hydroxy-4-methyl-2-oxoglutarate aldolase
MIRRIVLTLPVLAIGSFFLTNRISSQNASQPLIEGFKKTTVASVSDAVDQICKKRGFLDASMRPIYGTQIVGRAVTSLVKPTPAEQATPSLATKHSLEIIDTSRVGDVAVIVMEDGLNVAAIGGLMATAAKSRDMAGMIIDGGVRDVSEIRTLQLPVFARSVTPASAVGRYATVAKNVPVECAGVTVNPGDIIVAGEDGVVVVPQEDAAEVLKRAQEIDERETKMVPEIKKYKGLQKVVELFQRI